MWECVFVYLRISRHGANKNSLNHSQTNQDHLSDSYWITEADNEYKMKTFDTILPTVPVLIMATVLFRGSVNTA